MIPGVGGRLLTEAFVRDQLPSLPGAVAAPAAAVREIQGWAERVEARLGPAASVRAITDGAIVPLLRALELDVVSRRDTNEACVVGTAHRGQAGPDVVIVGWAEPLARAWRTTVRHAIAGDRRWALCSNGTFLRIVDAQRTWSRDFLEFDLAGLAHAAECAALLWCLLRGPAIATGSPLLDRAAAMSAQYGVDVCRALGAGAVEALETLVTALGTDGRSTAPHVRARPRPAVEPLPLFQQSITVLYRVLFLLFAEARGLVPMWHPTYRDRYSIESIVTALLEGRPCRGLWHAVQAISRLAHDGCAAGELRVNAFNGRLFAASESAAFDRRPLPDAVMARTISAVSSRVLDGGRRRILYRDLDVEQLGSVYEQVLEYEPAAARPPLVRSRDARKASGTFYTPRPLTAHLVRRTLEPLVRGRTADEILRLRVLDPAMGSGAFLVAACRYLASAAEEAFVRDGHWHKADVTTADRIALRRQIALRCLYGVDLNPMAVQLGRLSLWLTTLAADKPLSFLDHHLLSGNSLVGATPDDVRRRPSRVQGRAEREGALPLFEQESLEAGIEAAVRTRLGLEREPDDTPAIVRAKERALADLAGRGHAASRWARLLDLWCAGWFWTDGPPPDRAVFAALTDAILHGRSALPAAPASALLERARTIAAQRRFLHWPLVFPEVFADGHGRPAAAGGFDAVIGNPPWEMLRGDTGADDVRNARREESRHLAGFVRESGVYRVESRAHVNQYQLFVERVLQIVKPGGRVGLVLPSGIASDTGAAALRRHLFDAADVDTLTVLDNRRRVFPIHRSLRIALLTCTSARPTHAIACRFGVTRVEDLDAPAGDRAGRVVLTRGFLTRISGADDLGLPDFTSDRDLRIVERIHDAVPWLSSERGWAVSFGRELNASDDRHRFVPYSGRPPARPVVEGKQVSPFRVAIDRCRFELAAGAADRIARHPRVAYRDVASATNRLTLIAAVVPASAVTTHTLFCVRTRLTAARQQVLCALLNSFVANYLVRLRVTTHVTVSLVSRLPVPNVTEAAPAFTKLAGLARALAQSSGDVEETSEYAALQGCAAHLYGLSIAEYEHVLSTFPLMSDAVKERSLVCFLRTFDLRE